MRLTIRVTPRASRDTVHGFDPEGRLAVRVSAAPTDGEANAAVTKLLAKVLGLPQRDVVLVSGSAARVKVLEVPLDRAEVEKRIAAQNKT